MSIKSLFLYVTAFFIVSTLILTITISYLNSSNYFNEYIQDEYIRNKDEITSYVENNIDNIREDYLKSYLDDPIYGIEVYKLQNGNTTLLSSANIQGENEGEDDEEIELEIIEINKDSQVVAEVHIIKQRLITDTLTFKLFSEMLVESIIITFIIVVSVLLIFFIILRKYLVKEINSIVEFSNGDEVFTTKHRITELQEIQDAVLEYRAKLGKKEVIKQETLQKILHESKTPVTILKGTLEALNENLIKYEDFKINLMIDNLDKLIDLLSNIPDLLEDRDREVKLVNLDFSNQLQEIVISLSHMFKRKNINLIYEKTPFNVTLDTNLTKRVIYNLLSNAFKYSNENTNVHLTTYDSTIEISDEGWGIAEDEISKIFEVYYRGRKSKSVQGEGLGLTIVLENLKRQNAKINVYSKRDKGTTFKIVFPLSNQDENI
jgi:signal transduction histidine kinase